MKFDLSLYNLTAIEEAVQAYEPLCDIDTFIQDGFCICHFGNFRYSPEQTMAEFGNYALEGSIQKRGIQ